MSKLESVSKVVVLLVLDRQRKSFSKRFEKKYPLRLFPGPSTIEINECILTKIPFLIENLVTYLGKHCRKLSSCHSIISRIMNIGRSHLNTNTTEEDGNFSSRDSLSSTYIGSGNYELGSGFTSSVLGNSMNSSFSIDFSATNWKSQQLHELVSDKE